jgi:hypothetical protein
MIHQLKVTLASGLLALSLMAPFASAQYIGLDGNLEDLRNIDASGNSNLLSTGTYFSVGSFGNRTSAQVATLLGGATDSASFGSLLRANYTAAFLNVTTVAGSASGDNTFNYFAPGTGFSGPGIIDNFTSNDYIYAVFAQATGGGDYRMGIFAAVNYNSSGVAGSQIRFDLSELGFNLMNLTTDYAGSTSGGPGAAAVGGGSLGGRSSNGFYLGTATSTVVPEPSSASLVLLGAAGMLALRRLRKNNV